MQYGKVFRSMYDGSLVANWKALVTFQQMIVLSDKNGYLDMTPEALSRRTNIPLEIIKEGIAVLEAPDPDSRTAGEDGRRIVRLDAHRSWGWQLVNKVKYRDLADAEQVREQARERQAKKRRMERDMSRDVTACHAPSRYTDTDTDTDTDTTTNNSGGGGGEQTVVTPDYHVRCVVALNGGMKANPNLVNRHREVSASEMRGVVTWEADGIPIAIAEAAIYDAATKYQPSPLRPQPHSLKYFDAVVRRAHEAATAPPLSVIPLPKRMNAWDRLQAKFEAEEAAKHAS
jgi:hypothetical protein